MCVCVCVCVCVLGQEGTRARVTCRKGVQDSHLRQGTEAGKAYGIFEYQSSGTSQNLNLFSVCYMPDSVLDAGDVEKD